MTPHNQDVQNLRTGKSAVARFALLAGLVVVAGAAAAAASSFAMWDQLVGQPYAKARKEVIDAGWHLERRKAPSSWEQQLQSQYPELVSCAMDRPLCTFHFVSYDGVCLKIVTEGENVNAFKVKSVAKECVAK